MASDDLVTRLIDSLESAANADPRLRTAVIREEATGYLEQGMAVEGLIDLSPLRHHLLEQGAPADLVLSAVAQLGSLASAAGLTPSSPPSIPSPAAEVANSAATPAEQSAEPDGFLPGADMERERERIDRALVSVVVRNADLNVDMEEFRDHVGAALRAGANTGTIELEPVYAWLKSAAAKTGSAEIACQETVLALVSLGIQAKTRYQLVLPADLKAMTEGRQKEILDAFNKRCPPEVTATAQPRGPKPEEKKVQPRAWAPEKADTKKKKSSLAGPLSLVILVALGGVLMLFGGEAEYKPVGDALKLPAGTIPCTVLLKRGKGIFCGMKPAAWTALSDANGASGMKDMKSKTAAAAVSAGFSGVTYGLDTSR